MHVFGVVASPRKLKNTDTIVQKVLDGCEAAGAPVAKIYLNGLDLRPCQSCKVQDGSGCVHRDDMDRIYEVLEQADGLVLGTPVYYNTVSSQVKLMIDRCYCLAKPVIGPTGSRTYVSAVTKGKKGIVVSIGGGGGTNPECVLPVFGLWAPEVNLVITGSILATHALLGKAPMKRAELKEQAFRMGETFAASLGP